MTKWRRLDEKKEEANMRKYHQLVVATIALISTVLFLFYKHEYDRLRNVLEVLETFDASGSLDCASQNQKFEIASSSYAHPLSYWRKIESVFIFSAYTFNQKSSTEVHLISLLPLNSVPQIQCLLWFEGKPKPTESETELLILDQQQNIVMPNDKSNLIYTPAVIKCKTPNTGFLPYAVALSTSAQIFENSEFIYIANALQNTARNHSLSTCVLPISGPFRNKYSAFEFLEFHRLLGITRFVIYDHGIDPEVRQLIDTFQKINNVQVIIVSWNPPFVTDLSEEHLNTIIINDCLYRNKFDVNYLLITNLSQLIVPQTYDSLLIALEKSEHVAKQAVAEFKLYQHIFCLEFPNDEDSRDVKVSVNFLRKTRWLQETDETAPSMLIKPRLVSHIWTNFTVQSDQQSYTVPREILVLQWYRSCKNLNEQEDVEGLTEAHRDKNAYRFKDKLMESEIFQLLEKGEF